MNDPHSLLQSPESNFKSTALKEALAQPEQTGSQSGPNDLQRPVFRIIRRGYDSLCVQYQTRHLLEATQLRRAPYLPHTRQARDGSLPMLIRLVEASDAVDHSVCLPNGVSIAPEAGVKLGPVEARIDEQLGMIGFLGHSHCEVGACGRGFLIPDR